MSEVYALRQLAVDPVAAAEAQLRRGAGKLNQWLCDSALPLWATIGFNQSTGGFADSIGNDGASEPVIRRLLVQARQIYVFGHAQALGWNGPWRARIDASANCLSRQFLRSEGGYRARISVDGAILDDNVSIYDQAFVLLALVTLHAVSADSAATEAIALRLVSQHLASERLPAGGYREAGARHAFQSNPQMHLLEAAMAWEARSSVPEWSKLADELAVLALGRLFNPKTAAIHEYYSETWGPAVGSDGRVISPGHQFEWAWLLERWGRSRQRVDACHVAERLFETGLKGIDPHRGVVVTTQLDDFSDHSDHARLWAQTEWLKAALIFAARGNERRAAYLEQAADALAAMMSYFAVPTSGSWRDKLISGGVFVEEPAPASSLYHIVCSALELDAEVGRFTPN